VGFRGIIRDGVSIYIGWLLLSDALGFVALSQLQLGFSGVFLLFFSIWFFLERFGVIPKL